MKRPTDGRKLLDELLDRFERGAGTSRRIIARPSLMFETPDERHRLNEILTAASAVGAVTIANDREAAHLIASVTLVDPERLYAHLGRTPAATTMGGALQHLAAHKPASEASAALKSFAAERWTAGKRAIGLGPDRLDALFALMRAADAATTELPAGVALRTRSSRLLGDSKALENALPKLVAFFKLSGRISPGLTLREAQRSLGLEKFPQPVLVAGPIRVAGALIEDWSYAGLPPDAAEVMTLAAPARSLLTIENLESFNRHVRECRQPGDIVVYTGGFPARSTIAALLRLIEQAGLPAVAHWGDIDPGGVKIANYLEQLLPVRVRPHLMTAALAKQFGRKIAHGSPIALKIDASSAFAELAAYLEMPDACRLEQEMIDPQPVEAPSE